MSQIQRLQETTKGGLRVQLSGLLSICEPWVLFPALQKERRKKGRKERVTFTAIRGREKYFQNFRLGLQCASSLRPSPPLRASSFRVNVQAAGSQQATWLSLPFPPVGLADIGFALQSLQRPWPPAAKQTLTLQSSKPHGQRRPHAAYSSTTVTGGQVVPSLSAKHYFHEPHFSFQPPMPSVFHQTLLVIPEEDTLT